MNHKLTITAILLFCCTCLSAYDLPSTVSDTVLTVEGKKITVNVLSKNREKEMYGYEEFSPEYNGKTVEGLDSIISLFGKGAKVVYEQYRYNDTMYFARKLITRSGLELIFEYGTGNATYFPEEDVITLEYLDNRAFNLTTGEDDFDPHNVLYTDSRKFRLAKNPSFSLHQPVVWQYYDKRKKTYRTLLNFAPLIAGYDYWKYLSEDDILYLYMYDINGNEQIELKITVE